MTYFILIFTNNMFLLYNWLSITIAAVVVCLVGGSEWTYSDQSHWGGVCKKGKYQSPIDLAPKIASSTKFDKLGLTNYETSSNFNIINNGHTAQLELEKGGSVAASGGGLPGTYYLAQMHFHWDAEHTMSGRRHPLELHLVHYAKQYADVTEGSKHPEGLAVIGILFKESSEQNHKLDPLIAALKDCDDDLGNKHPMKFTPSVLLPEDVQRFYRYNGSLTTPGCDETVVWTVMVETVPISKTQLESFITLRASSKPIGNNYRKVQELNDRKVTTTESGVEARLPPVTSLLLAMALIVFAV